jgi:hypothetical protein
MIQIFLNETFVKKAGIALAQKNYLKRQDTAL